MQSVRVGLNRKMDYHMNEAFKSLRTNILFCGSDIKVIAFTSCMPNEGKSSVSFRMAISMAEAGKKVLFMDADLRKSVFVGRYKIDKPLRGLSHFLSGQEKFEEVVCMTEVDNLNIVFAGPVPPNPAELLGNKKFSLLLEDLRNIYDYVIIDTPPLGYVIDAAVVAENCDGAVLVVEQKTTSWKFAEKIKEQLERSNCRILGAVLNKVDIRRQGIYSKYYGRYSGRYYGKYYGKYYGHEPEKDKKSV